MYDGQVDSLVKPAVILQQRLIGGPLATLPSLQALCIVCHPLLARQVLKDKVAHINVDTIVKGRARRARGQQRRLIPHSHVCITHGDARNFIHALYEHRIACWVSTLGAALRSQIGKVQTLSKY